MPPSANIPKPVTELAAVQRDASLIVHLRLPVETTEAKPIKGPVKIELRIGAAPNGPFVPAQWATQATEVPAGALQGGLATYAVSTPPWEGKQVNIAARAVGPNGKGSDWASIENLPVVAPPPTPVDLVVTPTAEGLHLKWGGSPGTFRIFVRRSDQREFTRAADVQTQEWTDPNSEFDNTYSYIVQRIVKLPGDREAESELSAAVPATYKDTFPPGAPSGLRASAAPNSVELSWDRNPEPDIAGYRVYRAAPGADFEKIAEVSQVPAYSDRAIEHGKLYRYTVTAFDKANNESGKSAVQEVTLP